MKITLYKLYKKQKCDSATDAYNATEILTEKELREKFIEEYSHFHKDNLAQYEILNNLDTTNEDDKWTIMDADICVIFDIFQDNDNYDPNNAYYLEQWEIDFDEYADCYD